MVTEGSHVEECAVRSLVATSGGHRRASFPPPEDTCTATGTEAGRLSGGTRRTTCEVGTSTSEPSGSPHGNSPDGPQGSPHAPAQLAQPLPSGSGHLEGPDRTHSTATTTSRETNGAVPQRPSVGDVAVQTSVHINPAFAPTADAGPCAEPSGRADGPLGDWPQQVAAWPGEAMAGTAGYPQAGKARVDDARMKQSREWGPHVSGVDDMQWGSSPGHAKAGANLQETGATRVDPMRVAFENKANPVPRGSAFMPQDNTFGAPWAGPADEDVCRCVSSLTGPALVSLLLKASLSSHDGLAQHLCLLSVCVDVTILGDGLALFCNMVQHL